MSLEVGKPDDRRSHEGKPHADVPGQETGVLRCEHCGSTEINEWTVSQYTRVNYRCRTVTQNTLIVENTPSVEYESTLSPELRCVCGSLLDLSHWHLVWS